MLAASKPRAWHGRTELAYDASSNLAMTREFLLAIGYEESLLRRDVPLDGPNRADLVAFCRPPADLRTSGVAVVTSPAPPLDQVKACAKLAIPVVFVWSRDGLGWWRQTRGQPVLEESVPAERVANFFAKRRVKDELSPDRLYRAKNLARLDKRHQLSFVDVGLMPLAERDAGEHLSKLVERAVKRGRDEVFPQGVADSREGQWLLRAVFWLVAGKILHDKRVAGFLHLDLRRPQDVFDQVSKHYSAARERSPQQEDALGGAAEIVADSASLELITTEALAHVYENAFVSKETRQALGTHSTPAYLVDYVVWQLLDWIEEIPEEDRYVFEPACGHACFLVSALRLLRELASTTTAEGTHAYLRERLHGCDVDPFALEVARLSLTLADIPHPDGWHLARENVFDWEDTPPIVRKARILLANPPFEAIPGEERAVLQRKGAKPHAGKAVEMMARTLQQLRPGAVFGLVMPQGFLHNDDAADLRQYLIGNSELREIGRFPDNVFQQGDAESAVLLGRVGRRGKKPARVVRCTCVREHDLGVFQTTYHTSWEEGVPQDHFLRQEEGRLRLPDLWRTWQYCQSLPTLGDLAHVGKGFDFKGKKELPEGVETYSHDHFEGAVRGLLRFHTKQPILLHQLHSAHWVNVSPEAVQTRRSGCETGKSQVLINYSPCSRGPWRLKAFLDREGHAFTSSFVAVRSAGINIPVEVLWALCNSPVANAYMWAHAGKRENVVGILQKMPLPADVGKRRSGVKTLVEEYFAAARKSPKGDRAKALLLQIDAAVLRLYDLPPRMERELLDEFAGEQREGVAFRFDRYYPEGFRPCVHLHEYLSDEYQASTADKLRDLHKRQHSPALLAALARAEEDFGEE